MDTQDWLVYTDRRLRFLLRYPAGWFVQPFAGALRPRFTGCFVANFDQPYRPENTKQDHGNRWPPGMTGAPEDAVVVCFDYMFGGPIGLSDRVMPDTPLPLSLANARRATDAGFERLQFRPITMNGKIKHSLRVWFGSAASGDDRERAAAIVASIAPAR